MEMRTDDRKHHDLVVDGARERSVSSYRQNLLQIPDEEPPLSSPAPLPAVHVVPASQLEQFTTPDTSVTDEMKDRGSTWQINLDHSLSSSDSKLENCSFQRLDQDGQILQENRRISWGSDFSPPAHAVHETSASQYQQAAALEADEDADEEDNGGSASQTNTIPSLYSVDSRTSSSESRPLTPEGANSSVSSITGVAGQEIDVVGETGLSEVDNATENSDYFSQSLWERSSELEAYQFELECYRQQCAQQQGTIDGADLICDLSIAREV